jgi:hypothetical protein
MIEEQHITLSHPSRRRPFGEIEIQASEVQDYF